jgi:hypothetical protein
VTKFAKGHAKAGGRRPGSPNRNTLRERRLISQTADKAIVDQIVNSARSGDPASQRLYLQFLRPYSRAKLNPTPVDAPKPETAAEAAVHLGLTCLYQGELTSHLERALADDATRPSTPSRWF